MKWRDMSPRRKLTNIVLLVVIIGFIGSGTYVLRGWIREDGVRWVVSLLYNRPVQTAHAVNFNELNPKIEALGFKFGTKDSYNRSESGCLTFGYERFSGSYECVKYVYSNTPALNANFIARWKKDSPALEKFILEHGWKKTWNERQPISEIFKQNQDVSIGVNYEKSYGRVTCTLSIMRMGGAMNIADDEVYVGETCYRFFDTFSGY